MVGKDPSAQGYANLVMRPQFHQVALLNYLWVPRGPFLGLYLLRLDLGTHNGGGGTSFRLSLAPPCTPEEEVMVETGDAKEK